MSAPATRAVDYLRHAIDACDRVGLYTQGVSQAEFVANRMLQDAVLRNFEVLGEAIARLRDEDPVILGRFPDVGWREAVQFRNRLIHGYADVDLAVVWQTVAFDLPRLRGELAGIVAQITGAS